MSEATPVVVLGPGLGVARSLGRLGVPVYGVFGDGHSPSTRSRYWEKTYVWDLLTEPPEQSLGLLKSVATETGSRPLLIPIGDDNCLFVADHAEELRGTYVFPDQRPGLARALSSKQGMYELCKQHGIPTPETFFPQSLADVEAYIESGRFPVMLKAIETQALFRHAGVRMVEVEDADSLRAWYSRLETPESPNVMIQELIPGDSDAVWMFNGYFDHESRCLFEITGQKLRQFPAYTGATSLGVCVQNPDVADLTKKFMNALGYRGILDIGYKYDERSGEYKLLDVNPRIGATFRLFVDSKGTDVARTMLHDLTGVSVAFGHPVKGRKWVSEAADAQASWRYYRDGHLSFPQWIRSFAGVREGNWFAWDDPTPFFAMLGFGLRETLGVFMSPFRKVFRRGQGAVRLATLK